MVLIAVDRPLCTASVCHKYQIFLSQKDSFLHTIDFAFNGRSYLLSVFSLKYDVRYFGMKLKINTCCFQIFLHRKNQRFILIVSCEFQSAEIRQSCNMMNESLEIQLHLQCTVPVFKSKHRSPVKPECRVKDFFIKNILDRLIIQIFIRSQEQLHDLHAALLA